MPEQKTTYADWLKEFTGDKRLVDENAASPDAVYGLRRYLNDAGAIWETAFTYTSALVVRSGTIGEDGVSVSWQPWKTMHHVVVPKQDR